MSIRAYKLIEIKTEKKPRFNCANQEIYNIANESDSNEIISFERATVESALLDEHTDENKQILIAILDDMGNKNFVEYYCY